MKKNRELACHGDRGSFSGVLPSSSSNGLTVTTKIAVDPEWTQDVVTTLDE
jgi:hypothetical protein